MSLPHRHPFRFVDRVVDDSGWVRLTAGATRSRGREGWSVAWMVEAVAQASALALAPAEGEPGRGELVLAAVDRAELDAEPEPGQTLEIAVRLVGRYGRLVRVEGEVRADGRPLGAATLVLASG